MTELEQHTIGIDPFDELTRDDDRIAQQLSSLIEDPALSPDQQEAARFLLQYSQMPFEQKIASAIEERAKEANEKIAVLLKTH